ncbi:MAG: polysaccharide deacetylase family protein [Gammaproteobacteria bacterium]|nr:polysaccharide deacetylase family protein [Gammaproteobacteria bacterium]
MNLITQTSKIVAILAVCLGPLSSLWIDEAKGNESQVRENQAVILMYHHFGVGKHPSTNIRLEQFEAHLNHLSNVGYQIWPLTKVTEYIKKNQPFPARVASITIDDAYMSVYTEAYPRLLKRSWPFTVFVATDGVDRNFRSYMTWKQMREMQNNGATFANHSASHDYLIRKNPGENDQQWQTRVTNDIQRAQKRLTVELGEAPRLFAYPYGEYNTALANIVTKMGYVAFGQHSGPAGINDDIRALPRFPMAEKFAGIKDFKQKTASLAFFIEKQTPFEPSINQRNNPPTLEINLADKRDMNLDQLTCFASGQGRAEVTWLNSQQTQFSVKAKIPLPAGRSRYNCTAPSSEKGRFYWYSHMWILSPAKTPPDRN